MVLNEEDQNPMDLRRKVRTDSIAESFASGCSSALVDVVQIVALIEDVIVMTVRAQVNVIKVQAIDLLLLNGTAVPLVFRTGLQPDANQRPKARYSRGLLANRFSL